MRQPMGQISEVKDIADAASELLQDVFGKDKNPCRLVYGIASLPLGTPVELEVIFRGGGVREAPYATEEMAAFHNRRT